MPMWPYPFTVYQVHEYGEYLYEFMRGFRLGTDSQLDICEVAFSALFESWYEANQYIRFAFEDDDLSDIIEGVFRHADSLTWVFPMTIGCNVSWRFIQLHKNA